MPVKGGRPNQRGRTRRDLLEAALRASSSGKTPNLDDIAEEARVSRATAYRYFPNATTCLPRRLFTSRFRTHRFCRKLLTTSFSAS